MATNQLHTHMRLLAEVRARGITYLTGMVPARVSTAVAQAPLPVVELLQSLAQCPDVRLRDTVIALLLLHPNLADAVDDARAQVIPQTAEYLATLVLATLYLQRQWYWLLDLSLGHAPSVPETSFAAYWRDRGLPAPALDFGRPGLIALNAAEQQHTGLLVKYSGDWQNQIDHLLYQAWHGRGNTARAVPPAIMPPWSNEEAATMSMRPNVSRTDIERFLRELGRLVQHPGRIYLAGGAALVHYQVRGLQGNTADIDLRLDVTDLNEVENGIRQLKVSLGITIEIASPADFIPLPPTWDAMSHYVGRYGALFIFYFDFYTLSLAKIERGQSRDMQDVALLQQQGLIQRDVLEAAFQSILPQVGTGRFFNIDPAIFAQKFAAAVLQLWGP